MKLNHHIVSWVKNALQVIALILVCSVVIFLLALVLSGCRTVKSSFDKEVKTFDSAGSYQKDTANTKKTVDFAKLLSAKNFHLTITFDTSKKIFNNSIPIHKAGNTLAVSFIENLISLSNQNIKTIDISADEIKDSSHLKTAFDSSSSHVSSTTEKKTTLKKVVENKSVKSNSNLILISGIIIFLLAIFFAIFAYFKKTAGSITGPLNAIKNIFK